jgi:hypothetical protein
VARRRRWVRQTMLDGSGHNGLIVASDSVGRSSGLSVPASAHARNAPALLLTPRF